MTGRVQKLESLGAADGPGVRAVAFLQGCPLRCACCHNPETWPLTGGEEYTADRLAAWMLRYRSFFGREGGVTLSGGEPLMQADFAAEVLCICKTAGVHTTLDTSGCLLNDAVERLLDQTDLVLLDCKATDEVQHQAFCGGSLAQTLRFLDRLQERGIPVWLRQVTIPGLTDGDENLCRLAGIANAHPVVQRVQLLPFRKLCLQKYAQLGQMFPLAETPEPDETCMADLRRKLDSFLQSGT